MPPSGGTARSWSEDYRDRIETVRADAERAAEQIRRVRATARSDDGAVTVTVDSSGALTALDLGVRADDLPRARLAELVLRTARSAAADAAAQVQAAVAPLTAHHGAERGGPGR
ncbi:YbaB/EbfC family nucleoid-associated protein [Pseudonocardia phyllosphaerae]|uniref:YbaB/EbfC family nucleoid-associated protein n=1 Tax=Pseudonocardia phyllosphaerae TaxID=3390502 RepID=UPI0039795CF6